MLPKIQVRSLFLTGMTTMKDSVKRSKRICPKLHFLVQTKRKSLRFLEMMTTNQDLDLVQKLSLRKIPQAKKVFLTKTKMKGSDLERKPKSQNQKSP
jgi:hypothetical protein